MSKRVKFLPLKKRVLNGASFLDQKAPGWAERIDLDLLDMADGGQCLLAQLFDTYYKGKVALAISDLNSVQFGFYTEGGGSINEAEKYQTLAKLWKVQIEERLPEGFAFAGQQEESEALPEFASAHPTSQRGQRWFTRILLAIFG